MDNMKKTPLTQSHMDLKAKMVDFAGWMMPVQYSSIIDEHKNCREKAVVFDICHMGEYFFRGNIKESGIESKLSFSVSSLPVGKCKYGFLMNDNGGVIDDLIAYRLGEEEVMFVVNAGNFDSDFDEMSKGLTGDCSFLNKSREIAKIDVQGPKSRDVLTDFFGDEIGKIPYFSFKQLNVFGIDCIVSRTGYTGELGYEFYLGNDSAEKLWNKLLTHPDISAAGLGARDVLRLEVGYSLYGSDIDINTTPIEAGLGMFVDFNKDFPGKEVLLKEKENGSKREKIAFKTRSRRSARSHFQIYKDGEVIGEVTSGTFSPMMGCGIGLGYVKPGIVETGSEIVIGNGPKVRFEADIVELPFYKKGSLRK